MPHPCPPHRQDLVIMAEPTAFASASVAAAAASAAANSAAINDQAILDWCFTVGSLDLAVLGFLYNAYASIKGADSGIKGWPPIVQFLRKFCIAMALVLTVLTALAWWIWFQNNIRPAVLVVILCLSVVCYFSLRLVFQMKK